MSKPNLAIRFFALLSIAFLGVANPAAADATLYLIRHAEKATDGTRDPHLTDQGRARASWLANYFADKGVTRIYSTDYKRTRETVEPLAARLGIETEVYQLGDFKAFADSLKQSDGVAVVSGHSNTTPALANMLIGEERFPELDESIYDRIYVVRLNADGATVDVEMSQAQ